MWIEDPREGRRPDLTDTPAMFISQHVILLFITIWYQLATPAGYPYRHLQKRALSEAPRVGWGAAGWPRSLSESMAGGPDASSDPLPSTSGLRLFLPNHGHLNPKEARRGGGLGAKSSGSGFRPPGPDPALPLLAV